jgi:hypothetical protein
VACPDLEFILMLVTIVGSIVLLLVLTAIGLWLNRVWAVLTIIVVAGAVIATHFADADNQLFSWIKLGSLVPVAILVALLHDLPARYWQPVTLALSAAIVINILEATAQDAVRGHFPNSLIGLSLALTFPWTRAWYIDRSRTPHTAMVALRWPWIYAYTAWDFAFVVANYGPLTADHAAVLLAPVVAAWIRVDPAFYVAARTITLFTFIAVSTASRDTLHWPWYPDWRPIEGTYLLAVGLSVALACWSLVDRLRKGAYRAPG